MSSTQAGPIIPDTAYQPSTQRPTHKRYVVMVFLGALAFLTYFDRIYITWAQDAIMHDLKLSSRQMGFILGIFWASYALFEIPGGWLADRFGARKALARIVLAWSIFTALSGCASGFASLVLYRILFGAGEAGAYPGMARVQSRWLPVQSRAWFGGILWMLSRWGGAFAPVIYAFMMGTFESSAFKKIFQSVGLSYVASLPAWRLGFLSAGLFGVIWIVCFWPWFRDDPAQKKGVNEAELNLIKAGRQARDEVHHHDSQVLKWLFTSKSMWIVAGIGLLVSYCFSFWVSWLPKYLKEVQGFDIKANKWQAALPMLFMGLSCLITGRLSDWMVRRTGRKMFWRAFFPVTGLLCSAAALIAIQHAKTPTQALILLCIAAYMVDMNQSCHWANIVDIGGRYAAMAFGFMNMIGNIGNAVAPSVNEHFIRVYGWNTLFYVNAAFLCAATIFWFFNDPNKRFYDERSIPDLVPTAPVVA